MSACVGLVHGPVSACFVFQHFLTPRGSELEPSGPLSTGGVICSFTHTYTQTHMRSLKHWIIQEMPRVTKELSVYVVEGIVS